MTEPKKESKQILKHSGHVVEVKQTERDGVPIGIVEGYIATWDLDRGGWCYRDRFIKGAFAESIRDHMQRNRQVRMLDHHNRIIGGFPIETVREDEKGLFGIGEINLETQSGRELYSLAKQRVIEDFSVGFTAQDFEIKVENGEEIREIRRAILWEGSLVDEPMNPHANIVAVKRATQFQDLPLADRGTEWDADAAIGRVREFTDSEEEPSATYKRAFLYYEADSADQFDAYKLPIADVIDGELQAVPNAIFAAASVLQGGRGGVDIPDEYRPQVVAHIERYYDKLGIDSPFDEEEDGQRADDYDEEKHYTAADLDSVTPRDIENALRKSRMFSKKAAVALAGRLKPSAASTDVGTGDIVSELKAAMTEPVPSLGDILKVLRGQ